MPELPEVETIVRMIAPNVAGKRIAAAELRLGRLLLGSKPPEFMRRLAGQTVSRVIRRGKYIILELDDSSLIVHLGMTGQLTFSPAAYDEDAEFVRTVTGLQKAVGVHPVDKHTHLILNLAGGERVLFRDPRTFGKLILVEGRAWPEHPRLSLLGEDPLELRIKAFLRRSFADGGRGSVRSIKSLLLDQSFMAGVGNIYADEALFRAGIHPATRVKDVGVTRMIRLLEAVKHVLRKGILNSGTSFSDYRKPDGTEGSNYERLQVYGRGGQPCRRCGEILRKAVVAQRGTVFCPVCQRRGR
jgi:formamidopyrimidine-DNA glycosylase